MFPFLQYYISFRQSIVVAATTPVGTAGATVGPVLPRLEHRRVKPRKPVAFFTE